MRRLDGYLRRAREEQNGQAVVGLALSLVALIGTTSFALDVGFALHAQRQLQMSADAAALAGAQDLPNNSALATATGYSGLSGQRNAYGNLVNVTMAPGYPKLKCLTSTGIVCQAPANANAVVVKEQVAVPTFFAKMFGFNSLQLTATSTASAKGGIPQPLNVVVIIDTTASMSANCSAPVSGVSNPTKLDCAKAGVRALLGALWPCPQSLTSCGSPTNGHVASELDVVGMMTFPGLSSAGNAVRETDCSQNISSANIASYGSSPVYSIVPLSSDYRTSDTSALNGASSNLVKVVDWQDGNTCGSSSYGAEAPGGMGTYYAEVITSAQATLTAASRAGTTNVIIFVSDGDANASAPSQISTSLAANQCHQGIAAAQAATAAGTRVYSVAYGAPTSGSCTTDSPSISAYAAMQQISSESSTFYNQPSAGDLTGIFNKVANDLTTTRLLPDDTP
jgi:hypothetical protein